MVIDAFIEYSNALTQVVTTYVVIPLTILFITIALGKLSRNALRTGLNAIELETHINKLTTYNIRGVEIIAGASAVIIYTVGTVWALYEAQILEIALQVIGVILAVFALIAVILGARDFLPNYLSGLRLRKQLNVGDTFSKVGINGDIQRIGRLSVIIQTEKHESIAVPYTTLANQASS